jgi:hypothetical protein
MSSELSATTMANTSPPPQLGERLLDRVPRRDLDSASSAHHVDSRDRLEAATAHAALLVTATMVQHVAELLGPP